MTLRFPISTFLLTVALVLFAFTPNTATAQSTDGVPLSKKCADSWALLWPLAKQGDLNARGELLFELYSMGRKMPGRHYTVNAFQDFQILGIHTLGAPDERVADLAVGFASSLIKENPTANEKDVEACIKEKPSQDCARMAVSFKIVPSFDEYAAEIDILIASGRESICLGYGPKRIGDHKRIKGVQ